MHNPLLDIDGLPRFGRIRPEHVVPAIDTILEENRARLASLLAHTRSYNWDNLVAPLEEMEDRLNRCWSPVRHLHSVADNDELREAYNTCLPRITDYSTDIMQNHDLYLAYKQIADGQEYQRLNRAQQKIIDNALRDFRLSGVALPAEKKHEYKTLQQELTQAETRFEENVLDATHAWTRHITDRQRLTGLPESALALAAQAARDQGLEGWLFTLDFPSYNPVMQYADDRPLRQEMYMAYVTRASDQGPGTHEWDNSATMEKILALRAKKAGILGFDSYAHYSLERKMADTPADVLEFLHNLARHSLPAARRDVQELKDYARMHHDLADLEAWDIAYYSEKLRQHKFDFSEEQIKPYFPVPAVLSGLYTLVERLYGLRISEVEGVETWHPDVRFFEIRDGRGTHRGSFYLDLFARQHKRGGAWMDECIVRKRNPDGVQLPVAYLSCNFTPPVDGQPSLLTHDEVITVFHEFGHGLHHMLTLVDYPAVSGINGVPWDAVELPSQFMENWCWERGLLDIMARHWQTGAVLPADLFEKMNQAKNFQSGMQMVRQLEFALFDFRLHYEQNDHSSRAVQIMLDSVRREVAVIMPPPCNRFQHGFTHIFAGGYAAGYYSYKWAEVLSADAFSKFEEKGIFDRETGEQFLHTVLEQGGSRDPMDLFIEFRGRKPSIGPLLRHSGIEAHDTENIST
jgi:oligopeptidase A